jgi:exopolysaccharide biosynthesis WecB/TagA/CpsF family protein
MDTVTPQKTGFLGLGFDRLGLDDVVASLLARPPAAPFNYVVTPNADHFARLRRIPRLRAVYQDALHCLLDSRFLANVARLLGMTCPPVVTGAALTERLLDHLSGQRVAVIGMTRAEIASLRLRYPDIAFLHHAPPMGLLDDELAFRRARDFGVAAATPFLFIALGSPVQELLAYAITARRTATGIGLCIGSGLAFSAGAAVRAPGWMQVAGLEWLHRLGQEPARLARRYLLADPVILFALTAAAIRQKAIR